jgi:lipopolysaccharide biosynthesis protein
MWQCLQEYIANIDDPFDLYVNLVDTTWTPGVISQIRAEYPNARIYISENRGRDVGGYFRLMDSINFDRYVAFATLHSKKSPHVTRSHAENWRSNLIGALLGSSELIKQNLAAFVEDESVGIIGAAKHREEDIGNNVDAYSKLLDVYGIDAENRDCEYVSGTMMMIRSELMKEVYLPLREHKFESGDNKGMDFYIDGQLEHAVERIFGNVAKQSGYCFLWR